MSKISTDAEIYKVRTKERESGDVSGTPTSGYGWFYCGTAGLPYFKNDGATEYNLAATGVSMATDTLWDAEGDIAYATGDDAGAVLAVGAADEVLTSDGTIPAWVAPAAAYTAGARVYNDADISIPDATETALTFNTEVYDTDTIHDTGTNTNRLTCKTAGKYIIVGNASFAAHATGIRFVAIAFNGGNKIAELRFADVAAAAIHMNVSTIYELAVDEYVELTVYQNSGDALNVVYTADRSPVFMMQRIG